MAASTVAGSQSRSATVRATTAARSATAPSSGCHAGARSPAVWGTLQAVSGAPQQSQCAPLDDGIVARQTIAVQVDIAAQKRVQRLRYFGATLRGLQALCAICQCSAAV